MCFSVWQIHSEAFVPTELYLLLPFIFVTVLTVCATMTFYHECMNFALVCILCLSAGWRRGSPGRDRLHPGGNGWTYSCLEATTPHFKDPPQRLRLHPPGVVHSQTATQESRQGTRGIRRAGCCERRACEHRAAQHYAASPLPERHSHRETSPGVWSRSDRTATTPAPAPSDCLHPQGQYGPRSSSCKWWRSHEKTKTPSLPEACCGTDKKTRRLPDTSTGCPQ